MNRIGDEYPAGIGQGFDACGDVDAVAVEVVALNDHVAEIDADAQFHAVVRPDARVSLRHRLLHLDRAAHRIDDAGKFDQQAVAGGLDDAAAMFGDFRIDELMAQRLEAFERAFLVPAPSAANTPPDRRRGLLPADVRRDLALWCALL